MLRVVDSFCKTHTGRQRRANEDSVYARAPLFVVADGMGGAQAGEVASRMAVETMARGLPDGDGPPEERLADRVQEANAAIHEVSRRNAEQAGMGTTTTAAYVGEDEAAIAHVGDSRAYLFRDGEMRRLTDDHSLVEEFRRQGKLTEEEARDHPQKSIITRALGPEPFVEVDRQTLPLRDGDVLLLCSDGLTTMISEDAVRDLLAGGDSLEAVGKSLVDAANEAGGRDNVTVVLVRVEQVDGAAGARATEATEQATGVGETAPKTEAVRAAVATAEREEEARPVVVPRRPRPRVAPPPRRRRVLPNWAKRTIVAVVLLVPLGLGLWIASQTVYFIGTDDEGMVTLYRGLPYELPAGVKLYTTNFVSGVPASTVPAVRRKKLLDHQLRSHDDAKDLVRQLELGRVKA
jgi:PPM family protein phosphatase